MENEDRTGGLLAEPGPPPEEDLQDQEELQQEMPLPSDPHTIFLGGLFLFACLAVLYVAREILLPVVLAIVLKLLLQPLVRMFERIRIPRGLGALAAIVLLLVFLSMIGTGLTGPATAWAKKLPDALPRLTEQLPALSGPIESLRESLHNVLSLAGDAVSGGGHAGLLTGVFSTIFDSTRAALAGLFTTLLILFYLLVFGETFLLRVVEILPTFREKREAVELSMHIERDLSAYMLTVTAINAVVGFATFLIMWACGVPDPLLWGVGAFLLNYVPILGPMVGIVIFCAIGILAKGISWWGLLPAALYLVVHVIEGEVVTPMLMARRFTVNPVAVVLGLVFWYWLWGVIGAILAVPMLAIIKIVCDRLRPLRAFGHFLEG